MGFLSGLGDLAKKFTEGEGGVNPEVLNQAPQSAIASGLEQVLSQGGAGGFAEQASKLFANSNSSQQASVLNSLMAVAGPAIIAKLGAGSPLASLLNNSNGQVTPEQAATVSPDEVQALAEHAHSEDSSIIGKISEVYSAHPQMIQALGAAAVALAAAHISKSQQP
jgi:hypothetical protein